MCTKNRIRLERFNIKRNNFPLCILFSSVQKLLLIDGSVCVWLRMEHTFWLFFVRFYVITQMDKSKYSLSPANNFHETIFHGENSLGNLLDKIFLYKE